MRSGRLRHRVKFYETNETQDDYGQPIQTNNSFFTLWSEIKPKSGQNKLTNAQHTDSTTHEIRIRYDKRVTEKLTAEFKGREFKIDYVLDVLERNREMILICTEYK